MRKTHTCQAEWSVIASREHQVTICVVRDSSSPRRGYDVFVGGTPASGSFGDYHMTTPKAPTDMELGLWAQTLMSGRRLG